MTDKGLAAMAAEPRKTEMEIATETVSVAIAALAAAHERVNRAENELQWAKDNLRKVEEAEAAAWNRLGALRSKAAKQAR
jgi:prefoldin subunit 5